MRNDKGEEVPLIQLPCCKPRISAETGKRVGHDELPFMFAASGEYGKHLYAGQSFCRGMTFTLYDGKLLRSDKVDKDSCKWTRSLNYQLLAVDGRGYSPFAQLENCSLGHLANHSERCSVAYYKHRLVKAQVSGALESIFLVAKRGGDAFTEVTSFYTNGSAQRHHGIPMHRIAAGQDLMNLARHDLPDDVVKAAEKLRTNLGWNLLRKCGMGSFGCVIQVGTGDRSFAVKIGRARYDECPRLCLLAEAAILSLANQKQNRCNSDVGIFSLNLVTDCGLWSGGAALVGQPNDRVAVLAMELADSSAREIWKSLCQRFETGSNDSLLRDLQSFISGTVRVVSWMHECDLAHGDLKPDNILLKKLAAVPSDWRIAYCTVQGVHYQIFLSDWGHARWSGRGSAVHVYSSEGKEISLPDITTSACSVDDVVQVGARQLQTAFYLRVQTAVQLRHPGFGTAWIRAPDYDRRFAFGDGIAQREFDQSADIWALGAICARLFAKPWRGVDKQESESWAKKLHEASRIAQLRLDSADRAARSAERVHALPKSKIALRAFAALENKQPCSMHGQAAEKSRESWIAVMFEQPCPVGPEWKSLLDLLEGFLRYSAEGRLTAKQAQQHPFISRPKHT